VPTLQVQSPEFKPQSHQKKKKSKQTFLIEHFSLKIDRWLFRLGYLMVIFLKK
jgi:hypothetical protein